MKEVELKMLERAKALLERLQYEHRVHTAGTRHTDNFYVLGIGQTAGTCKVRACVRTPVATERNNVGYEFFLFGAYFLHIASTSDIICLELNPFKSIAPEGQVTVQAPQP